MRTTKLIPIALALASLAFFANRRAAAQAQPQPLAHPPKVAVICPDDGGQNGDEAAALLEAALSDSKAFGLVERQAVKNALDEQTLASLSDAAGAIKIGQLVKADVLLFCQGVKESKPELVRIRLVDTAGGVILLDQLEELKSLTGAPETFRRVVEAAVKKAAIPVPDRKLIGIIDVTSEEPGKSLDPLTTSLDVLLRADLAQAPGVVVLEREQLQHLVAERGLSGLEVKLRASTRLLEVKIKRAPRDDAKDNLEITYKITEIAGGKAQTATVSAPQHDVAALRRRLAEATLKALDAPLPSDAAGNVQSEAAAFDERAKLLLLHGYAREALRLAETAYALDPQDDYFATFARACNDLFNGVEPSIGAHRSWIFPHVATLEQLNAALLLAQVHLDASHRVAASIPADMPSPQNLHWGPTSTDFYNLAPMFPLPDPPQSAEQKVLQELMDITREEYRLWFEVYRARKWSVEDFDHTTIVLSPFLVQGGAEYRKAAQAAYEEFESEESTGLRKKTRDHPTYPDLSEMFVRLLDAGHLGNVTVDDARPLLTWLTQQHDPMLRVQGWNALAQFSGPEGRQAAAHALDALFRDPPIRPFIPDTILPPSYDYYSLHSMMQNGTLAAYTSGLMDDLEKSGDPLPLLRYTRETCELLYLPTKDDLALAQRMQKLFASQPIPVVYTKNVQLLQVNLASRIEACKQALGLSARRPNRWDDFSVRPIQYDAAPAGAPRLIWVSVDRTRDPPELLTLWRSDPVNENSGIADFNLVVGRLSLTGGKIAEVARGRFAGPVYRFNGELLGFRITSVLPTPVGIFISDFRRGLLVVRNGAIAAWTEKDGLPSNQIWSLAWAKNTLYAGADDGFMTIDPASARCKILASAKALPTIANPLDGGTQYRIANILPSPDGKSLWLAVGADQTRLGVWRYDLASGAYEHLIHNSDNDILDQTHDAGPSITWHDGKLLVIGPASGRYGRTGLFDPNTCVSVKNFYGQRMYDAEILDYFPDERGAAKVWKPIIYTPQNRAALTSIGFITKEGDSVKPGDKASYHDWNKEGEQVDTATEMVTVRTSKLATPELCRDWDMIEEAGRGFVTASYGDSITAPILWYFTEPAPGAAPHPN